MLASHGVSKSDVVSLLMPNSAEYIIAYFACWKLGAVAGPVNSLLKADEISFVINDSEAKALLVHSDFTPIIESVRAMIPTVKTVIVFDNEGEATKIPSAIAPTPARDKPPAPLAFDKSADMDAILKKVTPFIKS